MADDDRKTGLDVAAGERGVLRVFDLTVAPEVAETLDSPGTLQRLVGAETFDPAQADLFRVEDLGEMSLTDYLAQAHDVAPEQLDARRGRLDGLSDHVLVVRSRAFGGKALTLLPSPELHLVALLEERDTDWSGAPIETESARPYSAAPEPGPRTPPREDRARARKVGGLVFVAFMLLVALIVWLIFS